MAASWREQLDSMGYDLANPKLGVEVIAPEVAEALRPVISKVADVAGLVTDAFDSIANLGQLASIASVVGTVVTIISSAKGVLENAAGRWNQEATANEMKARDLFFDSVWKPGAWSSKMKYKGPSFGSLDLKDQIGGWSTSEFLAQYEPPGSIFMRPAGARDFVVATYPTYAYESPYGVVRDAVVTPDLLVAGQPETNALLGRRPATPPVPEKYGWNYICEAPGAKPTEGNVFEKVISNYRCAPVPGAGMFFSWGTYPWLGPAGEPYQLGAKGIATCLAMQTLTPVWAAIKYGAVLDAYWYWLEYSHIRYIPWDPKRQLDALEVVLDKQGLPFANGDVGTFEYDGVNRMIHVPRYRAVELAFRRFFALRELAVNEPEKVSPSLQQAIAKNTDFYRKPPKQYRWADPKGDNWIPPDVDAYVPFENEEKPKKPAPEKPKKPASEEKPKKPAFEASKPVKPKEVKPSSVPKSTSIAIGVTVAIADVSSVAALAYKRNTIAAWFRKRFARSRPKARLALGRGGERRRA